MTRRAPPAFDVVTGKIDRDRNRARSIEQARLIEAAAYHATQARLCRVEDCDFDAHLRGELKAILDTGSVRRDAAFAVSLMGKVSQQAIITRAVKSAEAERVFAGLNGGDDA